MATYTYESALATAQKVNWKIEDIIGGDKRLDFTKPFMPESLAGVRTLAFLARTRSDAEPDPWSRLSVIFGLVEEFILPFVLDHARPRLADEDYRDACVAAVCERRGKTHPALQAVPRGVRAGLRRHCAVIGPPEAIAAACSSHDPLAVAMRSCTSNG